MCEAKMTVPINHDSYPSCNILPYALVLVIILKETLYSPLCVTHSLLAPVFLQAPLNTQSALVGRLTHAWPSTAINNRAAVLNQFLLAKLANRH